jgi:coatomer subunit alpha
MLQLPQEDVRAAELAAYFTHCKLQSAHLKLALQVAMQFYFNRKLFASCSSFAHRLLELDPPPKVAARARQVLAACEQNPQDAQAVNYDPRNPFDLCPITFTPIYRGTQAAVCPYTDAKFTIEQEGKISPVGDLAQIGKSASGLVCSHTQRS